MWEGERFSIKQVHPEVLGILIVRSPRGEYQCFRLYGLRFGEHTMKDLCVSGKLVTVWRKARCHKQEQHNINIYHFWDLTNQKVFFCMSWEYRLKPEKQCIHTFCVVVCIVCFVSFSVLFVCVCVLYYCHRVATQLQLNMSYHIISYLYFGPDLNQLSPAISETRQIRQICSGENYILHFVWCGLLPCSFHFAHLLCLQESW
jgi:hypothetical protein